jgi:hypothetical protein
VSASDDKKLSFFFSSRKSSGDTHLAITAHCIDDCAAVSASDDKYLSCSSSSGGGDRDNLVRVNCTLSVRDSGKPSISSVGT